ncbi:hypothetical protein DFH27DRAFT_114575 [Peziza echinospora]|nr:hypothetical protein DFH27DRAFT_114575 [Peziza echinospora]
MDVYYTPEDIWRIQEELKHIKITQAKHARQLHNQSERLLQVERRGDESKIHNLWTSYFPSHTPAPYTQIPPFPSVEPQLGPFNGFDGQQNQSLGAGLQLDEVDVPRRGASRANSVRFDESAIQNHWAPESHSSSEYLPQRSNSGIGLMERSLSYKSDYKSDGRQSSMRSFDNFSMAGSEHDSTLPSALRPRDVLECNTPSGFDAAPAVIRCWLGMDCSYDSILYAVICSSSSKSYINYSLVKRCGFKDKMWKENGEDRISLSLFLGSATVATEGISPHNTLPRLKVEFMVVHSPECPYNQKLVQISLGGDILSAIKADILFSQRQMIFQVRDGQKVLVDFEPDAINFDTLTIQRHSFRRNEEQDIDNRTEPIPEYRFHNRGGHHQAEDPDVIDQRHADTIKHAISDPATSPQPMHISPVPQKRVMISLNADIQSEDETTRPTQFIKPDDDDHREAQREEKQIEDPPSAVELSVQQEQPKPNNEVKSNGDVSAKGPYAAAASKALAQAANTGSTGPWDTRRKDSTGVLGTGGILGTSLTPSKGGGSVPSMASSGDQSQRKPSRSMKVLRPSVSKAPSLSPLTIASNNKPPEETGSAQTPLSTTALTASTNGHAFPPPPSAGPKSSRSSSLEAGRATIQPVTKTRSSTNVVGGATAFKWMSSRPGGGQNNGSTE